MYFNPSPILGNQTPKLGELGEQLVALWLEGQGWVIREHRWRCRWGEIDIIAQQQPQGNLGDSPSPPNRAGEQGKTRELHPSPLLAFVEVKTRSPGNWDADGLLAVTPNKQRKLWQTAELFLTQYPDLAHLACRFDLALVSAQKLKRQRTPESLPATVTLGKPLFWAGYKLTLQTYIPSAFAQ